MTAPLHDIAALDVPLSDLEAELAAHSFWKAQRRTEDPSEKAAYALDAWLVTHPDAPVSRDSDFPGFAEWVAAREASNRNARKEAS